MAEAVKVAVRVRPLNGNERNEEVKIVVGMDEERGEAFLYPPPKGKEHGGGKFEQARTFTYDRVYSAESGQEKVFDELAVPILDSVLEGYNGTIFAYGQTGTGKTHTMEGQMESEEAQGLIPRSFRYLFSNIETAAHGTSFLVRASFLEIYNEEIRDLLAKDRQANLPLKESADQGVYVKGLTSYVVKSVDEMVNILEVGKKNRSVGATLMNQDSSRSHSIFSLKVEASEAGSHGSGLRMGKLNLVDLAGSERQSKTGSSGERLKEATKINLSLSALGNVISSLVDGKSGHIPYRDSKLTRLLQDSLGGNCKTVMVANVGPAHTNHDETLSTLRYANRAKAIKNKPQRNEDPKDAMLREFQEEIEKLKRQLEQKQQGSSPSGSRPGTSSGRKGKQTRIEEIKEQMRKEIAEELSKGHGSDTMEQVEERARKRMEVFKEEQHAHPDKQREIQEAMDDLGEDRRRYEEELKKAEAEEEKLKDQLQQMEQRVLHGNENLLTKSERQQAELERKHAELKKQESGEEEDKRRLQELEERKLLIEEEYKTLDEEVRKRNEKNAKLRSKITGTDQELKDLQDEHQRERAELLDNVHELSREVQLMSLVLRHSVPAPVLSFLLHSASFDEGDGSWQLPSLSYAGNQAQSDSSGTPTPAPDPALSQLSSPFFSYSDRR